MPVIHYQGTKLSKKQKQELIQKFTAVAYEVTNTPRHFFSVLIQEYDDDSLGSGGKTVEQIKTEIG